MEAKATKYNKTALGIKNGGEKPPFIIPNAIRHSFYTTVVGLLIGLTAKNDYFVACFQQDVASCSQAQPTHKTAHVLVSLMRLALIIATQNFNESLYPKNNYRSAMRLFDPLFCICSTDVVPMLWEYFIFGL